MSRRNYVISYDVSDDKRRTQLFKTLQGEGDHAQYSVFFCQLSPAELAALRTQITEIIHASEDQVLMLDLGPAERPIDLGMEVLGAPYKPPIRTLVV